MLIGLGCPSVGGMVVGRGVDMGTKKTSLRYEAIANCTGGPVNRGLLRASQ
jgi:hypothetical protein